LNIESTAYCVHDTAKLSQHPVAGILDNAPMVLRDFGINEDAQMVLELGMRAFLVQSGQPGIARYIGGQNGGKLAGCAHALPVDLMNQLTTRGGLRWMATATVGQSAEYWAMVSLEPMCRENAICG